MHSAICAAEAGQFQKQKLDQADIAILRCGFQDNDLTPAGLYIRLSAPGVRLYTNGYVKLVASLLRQSKCHVHRR